MTAQQICQFGPVQPITAVTKQPLPLLPLREDQVADSKLNACRQVFFSLSIIDCAKVSGLQNAVATQGDEDLR